MSTTAARSADSALVLQARDGDVAAFEALVRVNADRLLNVARLMLGDHHAAEDAVQRALLRAWRDLPSLREVASFDAWLQRLLVRSCYDEARQRTRWTVNLRVLPPPATPEAGAGIAEREQLSAAFRRLSVDHRVVLVLHFYLGLEPADIAVRLGIAAGTARSRLHYALRALRSAVEADERATGGTR